MQFYQSWAAFSLIAVIQLFRRHALLVLGAIVVTQVLEQAWIGLIHERLLRGAIAFPLGLFLWFVVMNGFVLVLILALDDANSPRKLPPVWARAQQRVARYYLELLKLVPLVLLGLVLVVIPGVVLLVRWSVVPYVVLLEPRPAAGPWAVARRGLRLTRRRAPAIFAVLALWMAAVGLLRRFVLPRHQYALEDLLGYAVNVVVDYGSAILLFTVMYALYRHLKLDDEAPGRSPDAGEVPSAPTRSGQAPHAES